MPVSVTDDNILQITTHHNLQNNSIPSSAPVDPHPQVHDFLLPHTDNTSPLAPRVRTWYTRLCEAHTCFCELPAGSCSGPRPLQTLLATTEWCTPQQPIPQCLQAVEAELLIYDIYFGVSLLPPGLTPADVPPFAVDNYPCSEPGVITAIEEKLRDELSSGRIRVTLERPAHLTAIYGKQEKDSVRIITDFSKPQGLALNDFTDNMHFSMLSHEDAFALLTPGSYMAKLDIRKAYRTVGVRPSQWHLLSFAWTDHASGRTTYYIDTRLPFGHAKAPEAFCRLAAAVRAIMAARGFSAIINYVDDFFVVDGTEAACQAAADALAADLISLGFEQNLPKYCPPATSQIFLGLQYNTAAKGPAPITITVPEDKLLRAEQLAATLAAQPMLTVTQLQSAVGYYNHISYVIWSARAFLRRLLHALTTAQAAHQRWVRVTTSLKLDLLWWQRFARKFNGTAIILQEPRLHRGFFSSDASDLGFGGFLSGLHFSHAWESSAIPAAVATLPTAVRASAVKFWPLPGTPQRADVAYREMFALLWAYWLWGPTHLANRDAPVAVTVHCDNNVVLAEVNNFGSRNIFRMALIRALYSHAAQHNIRPGVIRISSEANVLADAASRLDTVTFRAAELNWRSVTALTHPAWPAAPEVAWHARTFRNPGLFTHRAAVASGASSPAAATAVPTDCFGVHVL